MPTLLELAYCQHAVAGRQVPDAEGLVIADAGAEGQVGVRGQTPNLTLHVALQAESANQHPHRAESANQHSHRAKLPP